MRCEIKSGSGLGMRLQIILFPGISRPFTGSALIGCSCSMQIPFLHTPSDQKLDSWKAWERD